MKAQQTFEWHGDGPDVETGTAVYRFKRDTIKVLMPSFSAAFELQRAIDAEREDVAAYARLQVGAALERLMRDRGWL